MGSVLRYGVRRLALIYFDQSTVLATMVVNVSGSFALGLFGTLALEKVAIPVNFRNFFAVGLLGGYTTFSTLSFEAVLLADSGDIIKASASMAGNVALGLLMAYLGILAARSF